MNENRIRSANEQRPGSMSLILRVSLPLGILFVGWIGYSLLSVEPEEAKRPKTETRALKTTVKELQPQDYPTTIRTQGIIRPHNEVILTAQVSGKIAKLMPGFEDGAFFAKDEVLLELDSADFTTAVAAAEAQLARTEAAFAQEEARAKQAKLNWEDLGYKEEPNDLVLRLPQLREADANVKAATAQLEQTNRDLDRTKVRAPFDGRVRHRLVGLGQSVGGNTSLGMVFSINFAEVRLPVSGRDMQFLALPEGPEDTPVEVELRDALNEENETVWKGKIVRTEGALDESSLELFAIAQVIDPFGRKSGKPPLRIGQPVAGAVAGRVLKDVFVLPRVAVRQVDRIFLVDRKTLTLDRRTIKAVWSDEQSVIVRDPSIEIGSLLATSHMTYSPDNSEVEIIPQSNQPEMNAEVDSESKKEPDLKDQTRESKAKTDQLSG